MLYLMLVVVFSRLSKKWWFFLLLGWGKHNSVLPLYSACNEVPEFIASFVESFITLMTVSDLIMYLPLIPYVVDTRCRTLAYRAHLYLGPQLQNRKVYELSIFTAMYHCI